MRTAGAPSKVGGFTLIELMIVVAIIAIIASIAVPNLLSARLRANETAAISTLRAIGTAQAQFQTSAKADVDNDGTGEYGLFRELSGVAPVRTTTSGSSTGSPLRPSVLSGAFRTLNSDGEVTRSGFHFKMFLPGVGGFAQSELTLSTIEGSAGVGIDTDLSETTWCAYAWPAKGGLSGTNTFFVNQSGDMTRSEREPALRSGPNGIEVTEAGYAFVAGPNRRLITGRVAYGTIGRDGMVWRRVN